MDDTAISECKPKEVERPRLVRSLAEEERYGLSARYDQLTALLTAEKHRLKADLPRVIRQSIERSIKMLVEELIRLEEAITESINDDEVARQKFDLLISFQGVKQATALALLCMLPELGRLGRSEIARLVGVAPKYHDGSQNKGKQTVSGGRRGARKVLYMVALSAIRCNPDMKHYYQRLKAQGKVSEICIVATMRKILITLNAMLRDGVPWNGQR